MLVVMLSLRGLETRRARQALMATNTVVMQTLEMIQTDEARPTATPTATLTPTQTLTPTEIPPTPTLAGTATPTSPPPTIEGCDEAAFLADVTIPDGKELDPGVSFTKTWRLFNAGSCTWNQFYDLYFVTGNQMGGPNRKQLTALEVPAGAVIEISVDLVAPQEPGTYTGYWGIKNTNGNPFGIGPQGNPFYVQIVVVGGAAPSSTPTP